MCVRERERERDVVWNCKAVGSWHALARQFEAAERKRMVKGGQEEKQKVETTTLVKGVHWPTLHAYVCRAQLARRYKSLLRKDTRRLRVGVILTQEIAEHPLVQHSLSFYSAQHPTMIREQPSSLPADLDLMI